MSDVKVYYIGISGSTDVTREMTGRPQNLAEDDATEMTDWDKWISFWDRVSKAELFSQKEIKE